MNKPMLAKSVLYCGVPVLIVCDGNCRKAWGINRRPKVQLSANECDVEWLADDELGQAPADPGNYEGADAKPTDYDDPGRQNKWCARECERHMLVEWKGGKDFSRRVRNIPPK